MKSKVIQMTFPKLNVNYNVTDINGVAPIDPRNKGVSEGNALSSMYTLFWWMKNIVSMQDKIDAILPLIDKGSLFPMPRDCDDKSPEVCKQPKTFIDFVEIEVYNAVIYAAAQAFPINLFYACNQIRTKYPESFDRISAVQYDGTKFLYETFRNRQIEPHLEKVMFAVHDNLLKLQSEIPAFIASKQDPRLLFATQEEIDYYNQYYDYLMDEAAMRVCKAFADDSGYEVTYEAYRRDNIDSSPQDVAQWINDLKDDIVLHQTIAKRGIKAKAHPVKEGFITESEYSELLHFATNGTEDLWGAILPERFHNDKLQFPQNPNIDWERRTRAYLKTIAKQIELYYSYYMAMEVSPQYGQGRPIHWFEYQEKFISNWRKPLKLIRSLVDLFQFTEPVFEQNIGINHPFFEYLWDPKLCKLEESRKFDMIVRDICTKGALYGSDYFTDMQGMFSPYNFVEEYAMPIAMKAQAEFGKEAVPSKTPLWNLDTGECTQTTFHRNERAKPGHSFIEDGSVFQSASTQPLISRRKPQVTKTQAMIEQEVLGEYIGKLQEERAANPEKYKAQVATNVAKLKALVAELDQAKQSGQGFGKTTPKPPAKPKIKGK